MVVRVGKYLINASHGSKVKMKSDNESRKTFGDEQLVTLLQWCG